MLIYEMFNPALCIWVLLIGMSEDIKYKKIHILMPCTACMAGIAIKIICAGYPANDILIDLGPGILLAIYSFMSKGKLGIGDAAIIAMIGGLTGAGAAVCVVCIAAVTASVYMGISIAGKRLDPSDSIAFVPFVTVGYMVYILAEQGFLL